jgi:hypothetical protein
MVYAEPTVRKRFSIGKKKYRDSHDKDIKIFDQVMFNLPFNVLTIYLNIGLINIKLIFP